MFNEYAITMSDVLACIEDMRNRLDWDEINEWCEDYEEGIIQECVLPLVPSKYHDIALEMLRNEYHKCCYTLDMMDECWDCH